MREDLAKCLRCGAPKLAFLDGNCPNCLAGLATHPALADDDPLDQRQTPNSKLQSLKLGDYQLLEEIARGGMGVVYRARQLSLNRIVAVKVLLAGQFANETFIQRFQREAEAAASLSHPNIVSIHDVGEEEGRAYFSMEMIEGRSLAEIVRESPLPGREAAQLVRTIAEAVHFAHERGVLHRDLKPSNVMVDAQGVPHITDFGLAKRLEVVDELTLTGQVLGSPNYMPPEQADPKQSRDPQGASSDVYSVGAILYHMLTGRPPFVAESVTQTLRLVTETEPVAPRLLSPALSRDLETICLKCLEKEPQRRYGSARELAEELGRFLRDEPILARPIARAAKFVRWCRRKPALASLVMIATTLLLIVAIGSPIAIVHIDRARRTAEEARKQEAALRARAEMAERETQRQLYTALAGQAHASVQSGELGQRVQALDAIRRAAAISNSSELRREAIAALSQPDLRFERELTATPEVTFLSLDPQFQRIAVGYGKESVEIRGAADYRLIATLPPSSTNRMSHVATWSADEKWLAVKRDYDNLGEHADLEIWDLEQVRCRLQFPDVSWGCVSFHPDARHVLIGATGPAVRLIDLADGREAGHFNLSAPPTHLKFSTDGGRFAAVCLFSNRAQQIVVHETRTGAVMWSNSTTWTNALKRGIGAISWQPGGRWLGVSDYIGMVTLMDGATGEMRPLGQHKAEAATAEFSPDGRYLFTGGWDREFICWDIYSLQRAFTIAAGGYEMQIRRDGRQCAIRTKDGVQLHAIETPIQRDFPEELGARLRRANFSPDGHWLSASAEKRSALWDLKGGGPGALIEEAAATSLFLTPEKHELFSSSCGRWRITPATNHALAPKLERVAMNKPEGFTSLCAGSNFIVFTTTAGSQVVRPENPELRADLWVRTAPGMTHPSPDGKWLGIQSAFSSFLYIYALPSLTRVMKLIHPSGIAGFQFSPSGEQVAIYSSRGGLEFWSTRTWQRTRHLTNFVRILMMPEERGWWLTKDLRSTSLCDPESLEELLPLPPGMLPLAVSPDGRQLAMSVDAQRLQLWDLESLRRELRSLGLDWGDAPVRGVSVSR